MPWTPGFGAEAGLQEARAGGRRAFRPAGAGARKGAEGHEAACIEVETSPSGLT